MAIIIREKTLCSLCGKVLHHEQKVVSFPPFVHNERDPLLLFHDAAFHEDCFSKHHFADRVLRRVTEMQQRIGPGNRACVVCSNQVKDPDDYFALGHLTDDEKHALFKYNYLQAHRSCLAKWPELPFLCRELERLNKSDTWGGKVLERLVTELPCPDTLTK
jgi:hypothetical protein